MELVKVEKKILRAAVQKNRDGHRAEFEKAMDGFRKRMLLELDRRAEDVRAGRKFNQVLGLPEPMDHTKDYDRILRMLEMSVDDTIELNEYDFQCYVMDDWDWKQAFGTTNAFYAANGGGRARGKK